MGTYHFPEVKSPYYVYSPSWTHLSSGARALHLLVHFLNKAGHKAYLCPPSGEGYCINPTLETPLIKPEFENFYNHSGIDPIIVYPDIVKGNPFNGRKVVRWLLAPAGLYGGDTVFPATDKIWGYRSDIAKPTLCLPTFDQRVFYHGTGIRSGTCFYSHKYDKIHGNKLLPITSLSCRLEGSPEHIAYILRRSEKCYVYEQTEIAVLAPLCGCPVEVVSTPYYRALPDPWDFDGKPSNWWNRFWGQLDAFIHDTQHWNTETIH